MLKRMSGLYKLMSIVHRMSMKLESEFFDSRIKTETLQRNQMIPIVLSQSLWMFSVWLGFTSNLNSQTTWLKVKSCKQGLGQEQGAARHPADPH